ncbi:MAG: hypothetical protein IVW54_18860 [Candidatus Binataceae bacterium]|nr:hypothetical protein [Candidatus Binataceae bacterium]
MTVEEMGKRLQEPFFDSNIIKHGFAPFLRDYDVIAEINERQFLYRFSHCVWVAASTAVRDDVWRKSWADVYTDYSAWERAGHPEGYVWGVCYSLAYPGATYIENSILAREWAERLGKPMHEVLIETNGHNLSLVYHDLSVRELKDGDEEWISNKSTT